MPSTGRIRAKMLQRARAVLAADIDNLIFLPVNETGSDGHDILLTEQRDELRMAERALRRWEAGYVGLGDEFRAREVECWLRREPTPDDGGIDMRASVMGSIVRPVRLICANDASRI